MCGARPGPRHLGTKVTGSGIGSNRGETHPRKWSIGFRNMYDERLILLC